MLVNQWRKDPRVFMSLALILQSSLERIFIILSPWEYSVLPVIQASDLESLITEHLTLEISALRSSFAKLLGMWKGGTRSLAIGNQNNESSIKLCFRWEKAGVSLMNVCVPFTTACDGLPAGKTDHRQIPKALPFHLFLVCAPTRKKMWPCWSGLS